MKLVGQYRRFLQSGPRPASADKAMCRDGWWFDQDAFVASHRCARAHTGREVVFQHTVCGGSVHPPPAGRSLRRAGFILFCAPTPHSL